ncbi:MAG TPA: malonyl CoA-acyl carrier protein transacylase, partial [Chloroflexota bacterium]|nr:malonyl CoA-acyl carrier protein transacylase [Chloroflexota bacterium]
PTIPVIANVTAQPERTAGEVRANLVEQLAAPVRWTDSIRSLQSLGIDTFVEVGPGKVLTGLMRSIAPDATTQNTATPDAIAALAGVSA